MEDKLDIESMKYQLAGPLSYETPVGVPVRSYQQGTLVVHLVDAASQTIVWRGWATDAAQTAQQLTAKVDKAVRKIMKRLPRAR